MYRTQAADSGSGSDSSDNEDVNWKRSSGRQQLSSGNIPPSAQAQEAMCNPKGDIGAVPRRGPRRRNHVWGSVVQEQVLMENMGSGFAVEGLPVDGEDRGVESYDFTRARLDPRPQIEPIQIEGIPEPLAKIRREEEKARSRKVRERLGVPEGVETIPPTADVDEVVEAICKRLDEPKVGLIERVVTTLGKEKALELLYATENIEANGGLMINNGGRRRTPGGVYLHLLRSDTRLNSDDITNIFASEREESKEVERKRKRSEIEKKAFRTIRRLEEAILGERPASSSSSSENDADEDMEAKRPKNEERIMEDCAADESRQMSNKLERSSDLEEGEIDDD